MSNSKKSLPACREDLSETVNRTDVERRQELITLLRSTPKRVQDIILRFLTLSKEDVAFRDHYLAVSADRFMPPEELNEFMDCWIKERLS